MNFISTILATSIGIYKEGGEEKCTDTKPCFFKKYREKNVNKMEIEQTESETKFINDIDLDNLAAPEDGPVCKDCASNILTMNRTLPSFRALSFEGYFFSQKRNAFLFATFTIPICGGMVFAKKSKDEEFDTFLIFNNKWFRIFTVKNERCEFYGVPNENFTAACDFKLCPAVHMLKMIEKYTNEDDIKYFFPERIPLTEIPPGILYGFKSFDRLRRLGCTMHPTSSKITGLDSSKATLTYSATFSEEGESYDVQGQIVIENGKLTTLNYSDTKEPKMKLLPNLLFLVLCIGVGVGVYWYFKNNSTSEKTLADRP